MTAIKLHYSEALSRKVVRSFVLRFVGWRYVAALTVTLLLVIYLFLAGDRSWFIGVVGAAFVLGFVMPFALVFAHQRAALIRLRRLRKPEAIFELDEHVFRATSDLGTMNLPWSEVTAVWCFPDFWLLFFSKSEFITLPMADLDAEVREFVLGRVRLYGGKVS